MRTRYMIIILLVVWIGQVVARVPEGAPRPGMPWWASAPESLQAQRAVMLPMENPADLVLYQVSRLMPWPPPRSYRRCRRRGGSRSYCPRAPAAKEGRPRPEKPPEEASDFKPSGPGQEPRGGDRPAPSPEGTGDLKSTSVYDPQRWGLSLEATRGLADRLYRFWQRYYGCFKTQTRNAGEYAYPCCAWRSNATLPTSGVRQGLQGRTSNTLCRTRRGRHRQSFNRCRRR